MATVLSMVSQMQSPTADLTFPRTKNALGSQHQTKRNTRKNDYPNACILIHWTYSELFRPNAKIQSRLPWHIEIRNSADLGKTMVATNISVASAQGPTTPTKNTTTASNSTQPCQQTKERISWLLGLVV